MLTLEDCLALCDLSEEEIAAIAEHEHIPVMAAIELGQYLVHTPEGVPMIRRFILDDIRAAQDRGDGEHALLLKAVLRHFVETHSARGNVGDRSAQ
ncbi:MAG: hypothetical protein WCF16_09590 [Alphaproteobacteria bacterium]